MKKSEIMSGLFERLDKLEKWHKEKDSKNKKSKEDEEVCPNCGEDLQFVDEGIVYCVKCKQYFEHEEEKDE